MRKILAGLLCVLQLFLTASAETRVVTLSDLWVENAGEDMEWNCAGARLEISHQEDGEIWRSRLRFLEEGERLGECRFQIEDPREELLWQVEGVEGTFLHSGVYSLESYPSFSTVLLLRKLLASPQSEGTAWQRAFAVACDSLKELDFLGEREVSVEFSGETASLEERTYRANLGWAFDKGEEMACAAFAGTPVEFILALMGDAFFYGFPEDEGWKDLPLNVSIASQPGRGLMRLSIEWGAEEEGMAFGELLRLLWHEEESGEIRFSLTLNLEAGPNCFEGVLLPAGEGDWAMEAAMEGKSPDDWAKFQYAPMGFRGADSYQWEVEVGGEEVPASISSRYVPAAPGREEEWEMRVTSPGAGGEADNVRFTLRGSALDAEEVYRTAEATSVVTYWAGEGKMREMVSQFLYTYSGQRVANAFGGTDEKGTLEIHRVDGDWREVRARANVDCRTEAEALPELSREGAKDVFQLSEEEKSVLDEQWEKAFSPEFLRIGQDLLGVY